MREFPRAGSLRVLCSARVGGGDLGGRGLVEVRVFAELVAVVLIDPGDVRRVSVDGGIVTATLGDDGESPVAIGVMITADLDGPLSDSGPQLRLLETLTEVFHSGICRVLLKAITLSFVDRDCEGLLTGIGELIGEGGLRTG